MKQMLNRKKVARCGRRTGLPVVAASACGGTDHRLSLYLADGRMVYLLTSGEVVDPGRKWDTAIFCGRRKEGAQ